MRTAVLGASVLASLVSAAIVASLVPNVGFAQRAAIAPALNGGGLIALAAPASDQGQQITLIDPHTRVLGVYHVEQGTGKVTLKSVRNLHWDLQMMEFNGTSPLPGEIRAILEQH